MPTKAYTHSIYWLAKRQAARARRPHARTLTEALISDYLVGHAKPFQLDITVARETKRTSA